MNCLATVTFCLPASNKAFGQQLLTVLSPFGHAEGNVLRFVSSTANFLPKVSLELSSVQTPVVRFDAVQNFEVELTNKTGEDRQSPEIYTPIDVTDAINRLSQLEFRKLDHLGFNVPWFDGVHPEIIKIRELIASKCAYYRFPTGEEWDFILPANQQEIESNTIDLSVERRPKIEIVSFEKTSTPLIQIDLLVDQTFQEIQELFPEGLPDPYLKNVWVYLKNPYDIDICLVVGEDAGSDWSAFFEDHRLIA